MSTAFLFEPIRPWLVDELTLRECNENLPTEEYRKPLAVWMRLLQML
jgi:hypothetical protein